VVEVQAVSLTEPALVAVDVRLVGRGHGVSSCRFDQG
jgi:hypothetical protein